MRIEPSGLNGGMTMTDDIVEPIRQVREELINRHGGIEGYFEHCQAQERAAVTPEELTMSFTVDLDEKTAEVVQELAAEEHRPAGDVIRDALAAYVQRGKRPLPKGMGKYDSGRTDVSVRARELIRDAVKGGEWP